MEMEMENTRNQILSLLVQYSQELGRNTTLLEYEENVDKIDNWAKENEDANDFIDQMKLTLRRLEENTKSQEYEYKKLLERKYVVEEPIPQKKVSLPSIDSAVVNSVNDVPNTKMYFVTSIGQFAIRINGVLLYGNLGKVGKNLERTIECNKTLCKNPKCKFYHNPMKYLWKYDIRNFTPASWIYDPLTTRIGTKRRICNDSDVTMSKKEDFEYQMNLMIHDLLILLQMAQILQPSRKRQ